MMEKVEFSEMQTTDSHNPRTLGLYPEGYDEYGLIPEDRARMLEAQKGKCLICNKIFPPARKNPEARRRYDVDHHHGTGRVRGLLCHRDNKMLSISDDYPYHFVKAAMYLVKNAITHKYTEQLRPMKDQKDWQKIYMKLYQIAKEIEA